MKVHICQLCQKRPASVHMTEVETPESEPVVHSLHVCSSCVDQLDINPTLHIPPIEDILAKYEHDDGDSAAFPSETADDAESETTSSSGEAAGLNPCPDCHITWREIMRVRRFGCAEDYRHFRKQVARMLKSIHDATAHIGRQPGEVGDDILSQRIDLERALEEAVANENFEEAARLRDQIREHS